MWRNRTIANGPTEERIRDRMLLGDAVGSPSLDLVFTSGVLDSSRIDFQRTTAGTYYRGPFNQNLLVRSDDLTATWTNEGFLAFGSGSVANDPSVAAPDGTFTADKVIENTSTGQHRTFQSRSGLISGQVFTASVYLKSAGRTSVGVWETIVGGAVFDLSNGSVQSTNAGVTATINDAGNGWYRCSISLATGGTSFTLQIRGFVAGSATYTGDGTSGWYVWGAQLTEGSLLTPYIPTTTAAITQGQIASSQPWNLFLRSQEFDVSPWASAVTGAGVGPVITADAAVAPDGTTTAEQINFNCGGLTASDRCIRRQSLSLGATTYTVSVWARSATGTTQHIQFHTDGGTSATTFAVGTSWQRLTLTYTSVGGSLNTGLELRGNNTAGVTTSSIFVWGAQLNEGTSALEYRSTTSSALWLPRFENDPVTGEARGLLIEGGTTNLLQQSAAVRTSPWTTGGLTTAGTSITAPDGTANGVEVVYVNATASGNGFVLQTITAAAATPYTFSIFLKAKGTAVNTEVVLRALAAGATVSTLRVTFDHATGGVGAVTAGTWTATSASSIHVGNGWYRVVLTGTSPATTDQVRVFLWNAATGNGTDGVYAWGAQVEAQSFASSYIPTTTATVARGADSAVMTGTNFSSWFSQNEGTIYASVYSPTTTPAAGYGLNDNTLDNRMNFGLASGTLASNFVVVTSTASQASLLVSGTPTIRNTAFAYKVNDFAAVVNGSTPATDLVGTVPTVTQLQIGGNTTFRWNNNIRRIAYWPTRLPNATLQSLTT